MTVKNKLKSHCYLCHHYFTLDELKDKRIHVKVLLSNLTYAKIPTCNNCSWDGKVAQLHMHELWKDEFALSKAPEESKRAYLKQMKNVKIVKRMT